MDKKIYLLAVCLTVLLLGEVKICPAGSNDNQPLRSYDWHPAPEYKWSATIVGSIPLKRNCQTIKGWKIKMPTSEPLPTPAVSQGKVYLGGGYSSYQFYAFDARTGRIVWQTNLGDNGATPAVVDETGNYISFNTQSCTIYTYKGNGTRLWSKRLGSNIISQPAIDKGRVYSYAEPAQLTCMNLRNGNKIWEQPISNEIVSAPIIVNQSVFCTTFDGMVYRITEQGEKKWAIKNPAVSAPSVYGDELLLGSVDESGKMEVLKSDKDQNNAPQQQSLEKWCILRPPKETDASPYMTYPAFPVGRYMTYAASPKPVVPPSGSDRWGHQGTRPMVINDLCYLPQGDKIQCLEKKNGAWVTKWEQTVGAITAPVVVGNKVIIGTKQGIIMCVDAQKGELIWKYDLKEAITFPPSVWQGWVYVPTETGTLYAFNSGDKSIDGWAMWGGSSKHNGPIETAGVKKETKNRSK